MNDNLGDGSLRCSNLNDGSLDSSLNDGLEDGSGKPDAMVVAEGIISSCGDGFIDSRVNLMMMF